MTVREYIKEHTLLFDGAFGTYYAQLTRHSGRDCEQANLTAPDLVRRIHREYLEAGCRAIKTNTFAVNRVREEDAARAESLLLAGWTLAAEAAGEDAFVFADIGPVSVLSEQVNAAEEYCWIAQRFLDHGAQNFLFETLSNTDGIAEAAAYIRSRVPEAYIIVSFAMHADGYTADGLLGADLIREIAACGKVDAVGFNCGCSAREMLQLVQNMDHGDMPLSLMPNAGYPIVVANRTIYEGNPAYFASAVAAMTASQVGASMVGGCCGTTPEYTRMMAEALRGGAPALSLSPVSADDRRGEILPESRFWEKLCRRREKVRVVELDPPDHADLSKFMSGAWELKSAGVDLMTLADNPSGRAKVDSCLMACKVKREVELDVLPHMTCRDRNRLAVKSLLLGLYAEGVRNVLLVTGDPIPSAQRDEDKGVFQFNSRKLAAFVTSLGENELPTPFHIFGALNVNARNFDMQLKIAREKLDKGMCGFLTQPVLTPQAFENLQRARTELDCYLLGGIIPITSARNAQFMDSEVNGISVDPRITALYEGKSRSECGDLAVEISTEIARRITPYVDGYYFITQFGRTDLICRILKCLEEDGE